MPPRKILKKCAIKCCQKKAYTGLHKLPSSALIRHKWIKACDLPLEISNAYICEDHFRLSDYQLAEKHRLKAGAIPSVNLIHPEVFLHEIHSPCGIGAEVTIEDQLNTSTVSLESSKDILNIHSSLNSDCEHDYCSIPHLVLWRNCRELEKRCLALAKENEKLLTKVKTLESVVAKFNRPKSLEERKDLLKSLLNGKFQFSKNQLDMMCVDKPRIRPYSWDESDIKKV